jgi:hypothetical protein
VKDVGDGERVGRGVDLQSVVSLYVYIICIFEKCGMSDHRCHFEVYWLAEGSFLFGILYW